MVVQIPFDKKIILNSVVMLQENAELICMLFSLAMVLFTQ